MEFDGRSVVVTGGGGGIGEALAKGLAAEGASVVVGDIDEAAAARVGEEIGGLGLGCDVAREPDIRDLAAAAENAHGPIDLFCSNAGIATPGDPWTGDDEWQRIWDVNVMAHVYAARAVLPSMLERGSGHLLQTASAAGLLTQLGSAPYAVTKHAAVAFAEYLAITYGDAGIGVSVLAPQAVRTAMTADIDNDVFAVAAVDGMMEAETVATIAIAGLRAGQFLILPHPEVSEYVSRRADDRERWIAGMQRLQRSLGGPASR